MCMCTYTYVYVYIYIYTYLHTHMQRGESAHSSDKGNGAKYQQPVNLVRRCMSVLCTILMVTILQ